MGLVQGGNRMSVKKPKKDLLKSVPPSGTLLYDKAYGDDITKRYKENDLTEINNEKKLKEE